MKQNNIVLEKSCAFALRIIKLYMHLSKQKVERELLIQLLKSGTSIGANIEEAVGAQSKNDFIHKVGVAYKEARETAYWLWYFTTQKLLSRNFPGHFYRNPKS